MLKVEQTEFADDLAMKKSQRWHHFFCQKNGVFIDLLGKARKEEC